MGKQQKIENRAPYKTFSLAECGPVGFIVSTLYFLIDPFGERPTVEMKNKNLVPIDNLRTKIDVKKMYDARQNGLNVPVKEQPVIKPGKW